MPSYAKQIIWWFIAGFLFSLLVVSMMGWPAAASWSYGYFLEPPDVHATYLLIYIYIYILADHVYL